MIIFIREFLNYRNALNKLLKNVKTKYFEGKFTETCGNSAKTLKIN